MEPLMMSRREWLRYGGAAVAGLALLQQPWLAQAFPSRPGEEVLPWADQPPPMPGPTAVGNLHTWEELSEAWLTPNAKFLTVAHYGRPSLAETWRLEIAGLVKQPRTLTLGDLKMRPRQEVVFTLECSGNDGLPWFRSGIGTARWAGTPLAPILRDAGLLDDGIEVVFWGADAGHEEVGQIKMEQHFARSLSVADALRPNVLLCYEMNGVPLPPEHGFPVRLIVPGWYGIANVKWLTRIEVLRTRWEGRFMTRNYVTIREETRNGETVWTETLVGRTLLKSAPARVTRLNGQYRIMGAAWGAPIARVEVLIDQDGWVPATLDRSDGGDFAWRIWSLDWPNPAPGEHAITSRAIDNGGHIQPAMDDPWIAKKHTYWESNGQITRRIRIT
jgi:DMSO/TMAO reductase YedYZ molybdopterin-dependent catalytic subunit